MYAGVVLLASEILVESFVTGDLKSSKYKNLHHQPTENTPPRDWHVQQTLPTAATHVSTR